MKRLPEYSHTFFYVSQKEVFSHSECWHRRASAGVVLSLSSRALLRLTFLVCISHLCAARHIGHKILHFGTVPLNLHCAMHVKVELT